MAALSPRSAAGRFPALAYPAFRVFIIGQIVSLVGTWMQNLVLPYLAYRISGQPIYLGLVSFAGTLPSAVLTLPAGVWVERLDKRKVVIAMQAVMMLQAFALAALAFSGTITIWYIIALSLVNGTANAFEITARQTMQSELVGKNALSSAIALNGAAFNVARIIGPALAAPFLLLFDQGGEGWAFFFNGVSYLAVIVGLMWIPRLNRGVALDDAGEARPARARPVEAFRAGQAYIKSDGVARMVIVMAGVVGLLGWPAIQQLPVFARDVFAMPGDTEPLIAGRQSLMVTAQGIGALAASLLLTWFASVRRKGLWMIAGQLAFALSLLGIAFARTVEPTVPLMILGGWGMVTQNNNANQILQLSIPREYRARVFSTYLFALQGITPLGSLLAGIIAQQFGAPTVALICGVACLAAIGGHLLNDSIRTYRASDAQA